MKDKKKGQGAGTAGAEKMPDRIDKSERIVLSLLSSGGETSSRFSEHTVSRSARSGSQAGFSSVSPKPVYGSLSPTSDEYDSVAKSFGHLEVNNDRSSYFGDSHWATLLQELSGVKSYLREHEMEYDEVSRNVKADNADTDLQSTGPAFFLGETKSIDLRDLVNRLPSRLEVDKLVQRYFNGYDPGPHILHMPAW